MNTISTFAKLTNLKGGAHISAQVHESKCFFSLSYQLYGLNPTDMYFSNHILRAQGNSNENR